MNVHNCNTLNYVLRVRVLYYTKLHQLLRNKSRDDCYLKFELVGRYTNPHEFV